MTRLLLLVLSRCVTERLDAAVPGELGKSVRGEAFVEFEDDHSVDECPGGSCACWAACCAKQRGGGARFQSGRQSFAGQRLAGHEPVQVWVGGRESPVGRDEFGHGVAGTLDGHLEGGGRFPEAVGDDGGLQGGLVRQMLVQGRGADAQLVGESAHGQGLRALGLQKLSGDGDDLPASCRGWCLGHDGVVTVCSARSLSAAFMAWNAGRVCRSRDLAITGARRPVNLSFWVSRERPSSRASTRKSCSASKMPRIHSWPRQRRWPPSTASSTVGRSDTALAPTGCIRSESRLPTSIWPSARTMKGFHSGYAPRSVSTPHTRAGLTSTSI